MKLSRQNLKNLVLKYFRGVDEQNLTTIFETLRPDLLFFVKTHGIELTGELQIKRMFHRLWAKHLAVKHDRFNFVIDVKKQAVSVQFEVTNTLLDGSLIHKSNSNFFIVNSGLFSNISVYMAGENTLDI